MLLRKPSILHADAYLSNRLTLSDTMGRARNTLLNKQANLPQTHTQGVVRSQGSRGRVSIFVSLRYLLARA